MAPRSTAIAKRLAARLRALRLAAGLTQVEVAAKLRVDPHTIWRLETGASMPDVFRLRALAKLYGTTVDQLLDEAGAP